MQGKLWMYEVVSLLGGSNYWQETHATIVLNSIKISEFAVIVWDSTWASEPFRCFSDFFWCYLIRICSLSIHIIHILSINRNYFPDLVSYITIWLSFFYMISAPCWNWKLLRLVMTLSKKFTELMWYTVHQIYWGLANHEALHHTLTWNWRLMGIVSVHHLKLSLYVINFWNEEGTWYPETVSFDWSTHSWSSCYSVRWLLFLSLCFHTGTICIFNSF